MPSPRSVRSPEPCSSDLRGPPPLLGFLVLRIHDPSKALEKKQYLNGMFFHSRCGLIVCQPPALSSETSQPPAFLDGHHAVEGEWDGSRPPGTLAAVFTARDGTCPVARSSLAPGGSPSGRYPCVTKSPSRNGASGALGGRRSAPNGNHPEYPCTPAENHGKAEGCKPSISRPIAESRLPTADRQS